MISVEKRPISWREEIVVEVRALMTVPVGPTGPASEHKSIDLEIRLFDNTGRQVGRYVDGLLARMRVKGEGNFTRTLVPSAELIPKLSPERPGE